jgi:hypothetical protein
LQLDGEQPQQLEALASSRWLSHGLVTRVRIDLLSADGLSNKDIATLSLRKQTPLVFWSNFGAGQGRPEAGKRNRRNDLD